MPDQTALEALLASSLRIEALLVTLIGEQNNLMPPAWRKRMAAEDDNDMVAMILDGATAEEAHTAIKDRRAAYGRRP
jgi:hypothetical protein